MKRLSRALFCAVLLCLSACGAGAISDFSDYAPDEAHRLTVYTSHKEEVYGPIVKEFEERTGIWVQVETGGTNELLLRIEEEADAPRCDVMFGGGVESLAAYAKRFEPYACADAALLKPELRSQDDRWTPFSSLPVVLVYNPRLVADGELTGWADLLADPYRGQIAFADPAVSGSAYTALMTMLTALGGDEEELLAHFCEALGGQTLADSGDVTQAVSSGACSVGVTLEQSAIKAIAEGANLALVFPKEGTSDLPDGSALVAGAPHPENARAFLDFVLGRDVQSLVAGKLARRTVRTDVADREDLPSAAQPLFLEYDIARASEKKEAILLRWAQLCGEVQAG